jgi:RNA polymerase sigma factor (sigma-70 family)
MSTLTLALSAPPHDDRPAYVNSVAALYDAHADWLTGALRRRYGAEAADELAQEIYARLARSGPIEPVRHPRTLLLKIAENLARNRARGERRRPTVALDEGMVLAEAPSQVEAVLFRQILLALPPKLRDVVVLNHVRGLTCAEIAVLQGISVRAVEKRMSKALALCAAALRD